MIQLSKIPHSKLKIIEKAIIYFMENIKHDKMMEIEKAYESMATELYDKYTFPKTSKRYPSKTTTLKLPYHLASVLKFAIGNWMIGPQINDYEKAIIEQYYFEIDKQLI